jgi:hypothetical protein
METVRAHNLGERNHEAPVIVLEFAEMLSNRVP